jgi:hypothetical protein
MVYASAIPTLAKDAGVGHPRSGLCRQNPDVIAERRDDAPREHE